MADSKPFRVLFVCMGNICRSAAAEGVFKKMLVDEGLSAEVMCDSAGTIGYHTGDSADPRMREAAQKRGYHLESRARQINRQDLDQFDLILTMDDDNYAHVSALMSSVGQRGKLKRFCQYVTTYPDEYVPDPYYGGVQGFEHVLDLLEEGCLQLCESIRNREGD